MIFSPESIEAMIGGRKDQTRRVAQPTDRYWLASDPDGRHRTVQYTRGVPVLEGLDVVKVERTNAAGRVYVPFSVGKDIAVCPGRGKKATGRLTVKRLRLVRADVITEADALAEGVVLRSNSDFYPRPGFYEAKFKGVAVHRDRAADAFLAGLAVMHPRGFPSRYLWALTFKANKWVPSRAVYFGFQRQR